MSSDTPIDLDRLEAITNAATPGPWEVKTTTFHSCVASDRGLVIGAFGMASYGADPPNAVFIAESRTAMPDLIAECRQLRAENERLRAELIQSQASIDRATNHALAQLEAYRVTADANGDSTATYYAALCHHYTQMLSVLRSPNE